MNQIESTAVPRRRETASLSRLSPIEGVMVAFDAGVYLRVNESAMLIWDLIDAKRSISDIADAFAERFALTEAVALEDTRACLLRFLEVQIIDV